MPRIKQHKNEKSTADWVIRRVCDNLKLINYRERFLQFQLISNDHRFNNIYVNYWNNEQS